jgi:hypothetical protein
MEGQGGGEAQGVADPKKQKKITSPYQRVLFMLYVGTYVGGKARSTFQIE